jgi:hypothetical protein
MLGYNIVDDLKTFAKKNKWHFQYGQLFWQNIEASNANLLNGQLVLGVLPFELTPSFSIANKLISGQWSGVIQLGLKYDSDGTDVNLAETEFEKFEKRLSMLSDLLLVNLTAFLCEYKKYTVTSARMYYDVNRYDENLDFVSIQITLIQ